LSPNGRKAVVLETVPAATLLAVTLLAATLLAATLAAGCGGSGKQAQTTVAAAPHQAVSLSSAAYEATMRRLGRKLALSVRSMYPIVETQPGAAVSIQTAAKIERTRVVVASVSASVEAIIPPAPIRADHQRLVTGLKELRVELDELIHVLQKGGPRAFGAYASLPGLRVIDQARSSIEDKGYAIG
jgi:hypothetical protein